MEAPSSDDKTFLIGFGSRFCMFEEIAVLCFCCVKRPNEGSECMSIFKLRMIWPLSWYEVTSGNRVRFASILYLLPAVVAALGGDRRNVEGLADCFGYVCSI